MWSDPECTVIVDMSELSSGVTAVRLSREKLPRYQPHHRAKHELLRRYMDVWLPKLGFTYDQVALVDGFASAGRYRDGERGSPLIMLDAYLGRSAGQLFSDDSVVVPPDTRILGEMLRTEFGERVFPITEAEDFALCRTRYLDKPHLRQWALRPLEQTGKIEVVESSRRRKSDYPTGTKIRFTQ